MKPIEFSVRIDRPLDEVYTYSADLNNLPAWGDGVVGCDMVTDGPVDVGSIFVVKNKMGGRVQAFESRVIAMKPDSEFGFKTGSGSMQYTSIRTYEKHDGKTIVTERITTEISGIMKLAAPLLNMFVKNSHYKSLQNLKALLEQ